MSYVILKGAKVTCPGCSDHIATISRDIEYGEPVSQDQFTWVNQRFEFGEQCRCKVCGDYWSMSNYGAGKVHTEHGWKP